MVNYQFVTLALGVLSGLGGAVLLWSGVQYYRHGATIGGALPLVDRPGTGSLATVEGTIGEPLGGKTLESALGGTTCVAYSSRKITRRARDQRDIPRAGLNGADVRERIRAESDSIPFTIEDETGPVHVDATDAHVAVANDDYEHVSINQVVENKGLIYGVLRFLVSAASAADENRERQYLEACFRTGDVVRVVGVLNRNDSAGTATLIGQHGAPLVVSTLSLTELADRFRSRGTGRAIWGVVGVAIAGLVFATALGLV